MLYLHNGAIHKFPLDKEILYLGRSSKNDMCIREDFVSKKHAKISVLGDEILIEDLQSKNGIFFENMKVSKMRIQLNESFRIGFMEFFLKKGNPQEIMLPAEVSPLVWKVSDLISSSWGESAARLDGYDRVLIAALYNGFKIQKFPDILEQIKGPLGQVFDRGILLIATFLEDENKILTAVNFDEDPLELDALIQQIEIPEQEVLQRLIGEELYYYSFPLEYKGLPTSLILLVNTGSGISHQAVQFMRDLARELSLIHRLIEQNRKPEQLIEEGGVGIDIVGEDETIVKLREKCKKISRSDLSVLVEGEVGTGKDLFAQWIHLHSDRSRDKLVKVNCAGLAEDQLEIELFGRPDRPGKIELSSEGTLVLDEIGEIPPGLQARILRIIQERELYRVGGDQPVPVDLRIVSLSRHSIKDLLDNNLIRRELYYQIAPISIYIPPLRDRTEDIVPLIRHFTEQLNRLDHLEIEDFAPEAIEALEIYDWPGNVRELENEIKSAVNQAGTGGTVDLSMLKQEVVACFQNEKEDDRGDDESEREEIEAVLEECKWNKSRAARRLEISRTALYKKMKRLGIK